MILVRMAWRNLWRNRRRTELTAGAMALGLAFCMFMESLMGGSYARVFDDVVTRGLGHAQLHHPQHPGRRGLWDVIAGADALVGEIRGRPEVLGASPRLFGHALLGLGDHVAGVQLLGVDPPAEGRLTGVSERVVRGRYLGERPEREIVLGFDLAERLDAEPGDAVVAVTQAADGSLGNELYTVVGVVRTGSVARDRATALLHIEDARTLLVLPGAAHEIALVAADRDAVAAMAAAVAPIASAHGLLFRTWDQLDPQMAAMIEVGESVGGVLLGFVFGLAALGILNTMLMSVFERTREFGLLRALGLRPRQIVALVGLEALAMAAVAMALGLGLGLAAVGWLVLRGLDLSLWIGSYSVAGVELDPYMFGTFEPGGIVRAVVGLGLVSVLAALWPAVRAARLRPVDAMREA